MYDSNNYYSFEQKCVISIDYCEEIKMFHAAVCTFHLLLIVCNGLTYNGDNSALTNIPDDIPNDVTDITLQKNNIAAITTIDPFPNLRKFVLNFNDLTELPFLDNVGASLETLEIKYNKITVIDTTYLKNLIKLRFLHLNGNQNLAGFTDETFFMNSLRYLSLTSTGFTKWPYYLNIWDSIWTVEFSYNIFTFDTFKQIPVHIILLVGGNYGSMLPDFSNVSSTLTVLQLKNSQVSIVPYERLATLTSLTLLDLSGNPLSALPDPPYLNIAELLLTNTLFSKCTKHWPNNRKIIYWWNKATLQ